MFAPVGVACVYPFIRALRGAGALNSFFICWGLVVFSTLVFAVGFPLGASLISMEVVNEVFYWVPEPLGILRMFFFGWFYAAVTVLAGLVIRWMMQRSRRGADQPAGAGFLKNQGAAMIVLSLVAVVGFLFEWMHHALSPPGDDELLWTFTAHRASFERLRDMLKVDEGLHRVGVWGVDTGGVSAMPPLGKITSQRFNEYMALFKDTGTKQVRLQPDVAYGSEFVLWHEGFAGDSTIVELCWKESAPARLVPSLDRYYWNHHSSGVRTGLVYRHIEGNWYLATDIGSE